MGLVRVEIGISSPATPENEERLEVLVDNGAILSVVPRIIIERLGVRPLGARAFRGFGVVIRRETGVIQMSYDGVVAGVTVVFGEENEPAIMGVTALETLGYEVDPATGELKRTEMLLLPVLS
jgi:predicted aspartyl protease